MKKITKVLSCVFLSMVSVLCVALGFGCNAEKPTNGTEVKEYKKGDVVLLNGFESINDLYAVKQINAGYDSVGAANVSEERFVSGKSSLKYSYVSGGNPLILQRIDQTQDKDLDFAIVESASVSVFNDSEKNISVDLRVILNGGVALLTSEEYEIAPKTWTTVKFELDAISRTKNKDDIVGIAINLDVKASPADYFLDDLCVTIGEPVTDEQLAAPVIEAIDGVPEAEEVVSYGDMMKVLTAKNAYDALNDSAKVKVTNADKLEECVRKAEGFGLLFDAGNNLFTMTTTSGAGYDWSGYMTNVWDENYGGIITLDVLSVGSGNIIELFHSAFEKAEEYDRAIFCIYNPTKTEKTLLYATGQGWSGKTTAFSLKPESWTDLSIPIATLNAEGGYLLIQNSKANGWKFSGILGITVQKRAEDVKKLIAELPEAEAVAESDIEAVLYAKEQYDELTESAKSLVDNYAKLLEELKILVYEEETRPIIEMIESLPLPENIGSLEDVFSIENAKEAYDELSDGAKECIINAEKLERCVDTAISFVNGVEAFKGFVNVLESKTDKDEIIFIVLTAKSIYEGLTEGQKAEIPAETYAIYERHLTIAEGYVLLYDALEESLLTDPAPGYYVNDSVVRKTIDEKFGGVFALKVLKPYTGGQASFKPYGRIDTQGIAAVTFYIKNGTEAYVNKLGVFRNDYGNSFNVDLGGGYRMECGEIDTTWTKITVPVKGFYSEDDVYFVFNGAGANFAGDTDHPVTEGTWLITGFVGITEEEYNRILAEDAVTLIEKLPEAESIKDLSKKSEVYAALASYEALEESVKPFVSNSEKLFACVAAIEKIVKETARTISDRIAALPEESDLNEENFAEYRGEITACAEAYDNLSEDVKALVVGHEKLVSLVDKVAEFDPLLTKLMIEALSNELTLDSEEIVRILGIKAFYDDLSEEGKQKVDNYGKLAELLTRIEGYEIAVPFGEETFGRWDYGGEFTVTDGVDDNFGKYYAIKIGDVSEQAFSVKIENAAKFAHYYISVYNPQNESVILTVHGGYDAGWGLLRTNVPAGEWIILEIPAEWFIVADEDKIYIVLTKPEGRFDCVVKVSAIVGVSEKAQNAKLANMVSEAIAALPVAENITDFSAKSAISEAKKSFDALPQEAKELVTGIEKLNACIAAIEELEKSLYEKAERLIDKLPEAENLSEKSDFINVLYAKIAFDSLDEELRAKVKNADKLNACVSAAEGYGIVFSPLNDTVGKWDYGNELTASVLFDDNYGRVFALKTNAGKEQSFCVSLAETGDYDGYSFAIFNPTVLNVSLNIHGGYSAWGLYKADLLAGEWTTITLKKSDFDAGDAGKIYLIVTASETDASVSGEWLLSAIIGTPKQAVREKILVSATEASNLSSGRDTGNGATIGIAVDETYGAVWTLSGTSAANTDFHATAAIDVTGYVKITFKVYNPTDTDIVLVLYTGSWGEQKVITLSANAWTDVEVDTATYGGNFFFVINSADWIQGTWKITSFVGVPAENA